MLSTKSAHNLRFDPSLHAARVMKHALADLARAAKSSPRQILGRQKKPKSSGVFLPGLDGFLRLIDLLLVVGYHRIHEREMCRHESLTVIFRDAV